MKKKLFAVLAATAVIGGSVAAVTFGGSTSGNAPAEEETSSIIRTVSDVSSDLTVEGEAVDAENTVPDFSYNNVADVAEAVMPSIVAITNKSVQEVNDYFFRRSFQYEATSAGSGIIVGSNDTELLICTNNHVVEDANELSVTFIDEQSYTAYVKGTDPDNDLAVVSVNLEDISDDTMDQIRIARTGNSDDMRVGEQVVAIGNALGYGQSVTTGIISAKDRTIEAASDSYGSNATTYENLIQTDAAINFGNSGGALLNMNGEVIGINSAKASQSGVEGMGYAIPIAKAMPILEDLMSRQTRVRLEEDEIGYIGINGQSVSRDATMLYGIPEGIYVTYVEEDSPAMEAGLKEGDIITAFDGESITSMRDLQYMLQYYAAGETIDMTVCSSSENYEESTLTITLGDRSAIQ